jgi:hypothetical protein
VKKRGRPQKGGALSPSTVNKRWQRIGDKLRAECIDGSAPISNEDFHELIQLWLWRNDRPFMEKQTAKFEAGVKEILDEAIAELKRRDAEIEKLKREIQRLEREKVRYIQYKLGTDGAGDDADDDDDASSSVTNSK